MAAFTAGNIVVYRVGSGAGVLSSAAAQVFLDEYSASGTLVQSIAVPTADSGSATHALTASGSATSEGLITDSANGSTLLLAGYDAAPGAATVASSTATNDPRIVGRVGSDGTVDTGTVLTGFDSGNNIRGVASVDGRAIYAAGAGGVAYTTADSTTAPSALSATNTRQIEDVGGQLYYSTGSGTAGIYTLGAANPTPTSGTQTATLLAGTGAGTGSNGTSPYAFVFADLSPDVAGNDTLYVADSGKGIEKFSLVNGTWASNGQIAFSGVTGLTASVSNGAVTLFATSPSSIDTLTDTGGYNVALPAATALKTIATAGTNEAFRGVAFAPTDAATTTPPPGTTVSIGDATYVQGSGGTMNLNFTVTRSDTTGAFTVDYATADGTAKAGTDYMSEMGTLSFAANGPASETITVPIDNDQNATSSETFNVDLSNIVNTTGSASLSKAAATGTIVTPTKIYTIQGSGFASPDAGQAVTTSGVVTALASNGYYLQDPTGDGNTATSDGIFVFTSSKPTVAVGDSLDVSGTVQEYTPTSADPGAFSTTELSSITATTTISSNNALPAAVVIGQGNLPPTMDLKAGNAFYESLEGMRVTVENPVAVGPTNNFGEIVTVADNGTGATGLNAQGNLLITEGQPNFGNTDSAGGDFNPERIKIDSELVAGAVPSANVGTQFASTTGILNYDFGTFGVSATSALTVTQQSTLTPTVGTLTGDATHLTLGSYNIENFSVAAQGQSKVDAVASQIVTNLKSPDIIALQEVQDNSGPADDGTISGSTNLQALVAAINKAGGPQYAPVDNPFIANDTNGGQPGGNIRTAFLYRTDRVTLVPGSLATVAKDGSAITDQGSAAADAQANSDQQTDMQNPFFDSRPPLSAQFMFNGQKVTIVDGHFTSKGGSGDLMGSTQPAFDGGEVQRAAQAQAVKTYVGNILSSNPNANVIVTGDLNEFNDEEPLKVLQGTASATNYQVPSSGQINATATYTPGGTQILTDLESTLPADQQYDYVFEGNSESLVHTLASSSLANGAQLQPLHINAEFSDLNDAQISDHDALLSSYSIPAVVACFAQGTRIATPRGEVAVEDLAVGDTVLTSEGASRPIIWIGHRTIAGRNHPRPFEANPVRIAAGAFGAGKPARDLYLSPGHAVCVDVGGQVLIPASALINGISIVQVEVAKVTYCHIELESHDILVAEGLPAESYLEMSNRRFFLEAGAVALHASPDACASLHPDFCRPFHVGGPLVEGVRARLDALAKRRTRAVIAERLKSPNARAGAGLATLN